MEAKNVKELISLLKNFKDTDKVVITPDNKLGITESGKNGVFVIDIKPAIEERVVEFSRLRENLIDAPTDVKSSFNNIIKYFADKKEDKKAGSDKDAVNDFYTALCTLKPKIDRSKNKELLELLAKVEQLIIKKY